MINNTMYENLYCAGKSIKEYLNLSEFESGTMMSCLNLNVDKLHHLMNLTQIVPVQYRVYCLEMNDAHFISIQINLKGKLGHARLDFRKDNNSFKNTVTDFVDFAQYKL